MEKGFIGIIINGNCFSSLVVNFLTKIFPLESWNPLNEDDLSNTNKARVVRSWWALLLLPPLGPLYSYARVLLDIFVIYLQESWSCNYHQAHFSCVYVCLTEEHLPPGIAWYWMILNDTAWYSMTLHGIVHGTVRLQLTVLPEKAMHMGGPSKHQHHCHNFSGFSLCWE